MVLLNIKNWKEIIIVIIMMMKMLVMVIITIRIMIIVSVIPNHHWLSYTWNRIVYAIIEIVQRLKAN